MLVSSAIEEFLKALKAGGYSPHTISNYSRDLHQLRANIFVMIGREPEAAEINRDLIVAHLAKLMERLGPRSIDRHKFSIKRWGNWLFAAHGLEDPTRNMPKPRAPHRKRPRTLSPAQIEAIIEADQKPKCRSRPVVQRNLRDRALVEVLWSSGCRISEAIGLEWRDLTELPGQSGEIILRWTKGGQERIGFLGVPALDALKKWKKVAWATDFNAPVFTNSRGERLCVRSAELAFSNRAARAGISEPVHPHLLRHSFATAAMERNVNIGETAEFLGHKRWSTTAMYQQPSMEFLRKQLVEHHPRETEPLRAEVNANARAAQVRPKEPEEKRAMGVMKPERWKKEAQQLIAYFEKSAIAEFERDARKNPGLYRRRFEGDRRATLSENSMPICSIDNLIEEPPTLRFFAEHTSPAESAELLTLASRYDDLIRQLIELKAEQNALVARIKFVGAEAA